MYEPASSRSPLPPGDAAPALSDAVPPELTWRYVAWRLVFTKRNEMDLGYAFLIPFLVLFFVAWIRTALGAWAVTAQMWVSLVAIITSMLVATVPVWRARIMRDRDYGYGSSGMVPGLESVVDSSQLVTYHSVAPTEDAR